uniref:Uncharacterized protein n=1 Tax=Anguilla anguilla TaxID=7936 RepID=A0A0E9RSR1_ANGAN
MGYFHGLRIS